MSGVDRKKRYYSDDDQIGKTAAGLKRLNHKRQKEYLVYWFHRNFEDPVHETPYESAEGGYQYIFGGPYDARDELWNEFDGTVSETVINAAVEEVESDGIIDWAPGDEHPNKLRHSEELDDAMTFSGNYRPLGKILRGIESAYFTAGNPVEKPLVEKKYITPKFPEGIRQSDLTKANFLDQRQTALCWFLLNLEPYDSQTATAKYGNAHFGDPYKRPSLNASDILDEEFSGTLAPDALNAVVAALPGPWMWKISRPNQALDNTVIDDMSKRLIPMLDALADQITQLKRTNLHGRIGHNNPEEISPLSEEDKDKLLEHIETAKEAAQSTDKDSSSKLESSLKWISNELTKIGDWSLKQTKDVLLDAISDTAKDTVKLVGAAIVFKTLGIHLSISYYAIEIDKVFRSIQHSL